MTKKTFALWTVVIAIAFICGRYSRPAKVTVTKEVDTTKDQIINELNRQLAFKSSDKISITTTIKRPDGTEITRVKIENKNISINQTEVNHAEATHETRRELDKTVTENTRGIVVGPMVNFATTDITHPLVGGVFDAPVFGPFHVLGNVLVGPAVGASFGIGGGFEF